MARTKQSAKKSSGGKGLKKTLANAVVQRQRAIAAHNRALMQEEEEDEAPRVCEAATDDCRVSRSGKSRKVEGVYLKKPFVKTVPCPAPEEKWRFEKFSAAQLKKPIDERMRTLRLIKVVDDDRGALVEWMDGKERWEKISDLTWGKSTCLPWIEAARAFTSSSEPDLLRFLQGHPFGRLYDGASPDGLCGFHAVRSALAVLGVEVEMGAVKRFVQQQKNTRNVDLKKGTQYRDIRRFVTAAGLPINVEILDRDLARGGGSGVERVDAVTDQDGLYLVSAQVVGSVWGHVVAVWKVAGEALVLDSGERTPLKDASWVGRLKYVRRVEYLAQ